MKNVDLFGRFLDLISELEKENVDYVLIGGFAVILHGMPRFTQDVDLFIKAEEENIEKLQKVLFSLFNDKNVFKITFEELQNYAVIRFGSEDGFLLDIITAIGDTFNFNDLEYEIIDVEGRKIKIATVETLYKLKEKTLRAIDQNDLLFLKAIINKKKNDN